MEVEADQYYSSPVDVCTSMPYELSYSAESSMEVEADQYFSSPVDVCTSMPYELSYSAPESWYQAWVFWSQRDIERQSILGFSSPSFQTTEEKIKLFLQRINTCDLISDSLIQFWAPVKIADKIYLTTAVQPFALYSRSIKGFLKGLCTYRLCLENILIPVDVDELGGEEHNFGLPGRVFRHRIPEICWDINDYLNKEYLQRDRALELGIGSSMALPVFQSVGQDCIGVLEIITSKEDLAFYNHSGLISHFAEKLKEMEMLLRPYKYDCHRKASYLKARQVMEHAVVEHKLPLVQLWYAGSNTTRWIPMVSREFGGRKINDTFLRWYNLRWFLPKGKGVVGKAFSSGNACFCKDISILSINFYPLLPFARKDRLSGCFAICLKSNDEVGISYILEFFLPRTLIDFADSISFVRKLVVWLREEIGESSNSPIQGLKERLLVEVIKVSSDQDEPYSFDVGDSNVVRNNTSAEPTDLPGSTLLSELHHDQAGGTVQQSQTVEEPSVEPHTLTNERNIASGIQSDLGARNRAAVTTLDVAYGITREVLQQHSQMKQDDAAKSLGVSRATLKRICRKHKIHRWPPKKRPNDSDMHLHSIHPAANANTDAHSMPNTMTMQDDNKIEVKAKYKTKKWKLHLSLSAKVIDLEQEVSKRIDSPIGSFEITYLDEENDQISVTCDEDLKLCIDTYKSQGKSTIEMSVSLLIEN